MQAGDRVVRLEVYDPEDRLHPAYTRNLPTTAGRRSGALRLGLDDAPGVWRLKAIDTISGRSNEVRFLVRAR